MQKLTSKLVNQEIFIVSILILILSTLTIYTVQAQANQSDEVERLSVVREITFVPSKPEEVSANSMKSSLSWLLLAVLPLHTSPTIEYLDRKVLLYSRDEIFDEYILESEYLLRSTGLFDSVSIALNPITRNEEDMYIILQERPSTLPYLQVATGGDIEEFGGGLQFRNLLNTGISMEFGAKHRTENDIGMEGGFAFAIDDIIGSSWQLDVEIQAHQYRTEQKVVVQNPFSSSLDNFSLGIQGKSSRGSDFAYQTLQENNPAEFVRGDFRSKELVVWSGYGLVRDDRFFVTGLLHLEDIERDNPAFRQPLDNTGRFLIGFSSLSQDYQSSAQAHRSADSVVPVGAWGTAVLGKFFPIGGKGEDMVYVGGQVQQSAFATSDWYLFGKIQAGSGFRTRARAQYTFQSFHGITHYTINEQWMVLAQARQQTVWNWSGFRQLVLDDRAGLRGYTANNIIGDNRFVTNMEVRYAPQISIASMEPTITVFADVGTIWNQDTRLTKTVWQTSVGVGVWFHVPTILAESVQVGIDIPYTFAHESLGQISLRLQHTIPFFGDHQYELPKFFGEEFDYE